MLKLLLFLLLTAAGLPTALAQRVNSSSTAPELRPRLADAATLLDQENGLGAYHFGDTIALFPQLQEFMADGSTVAYTNPQDELQYHGTPVASILYTFTEGRLESISLNTKGRRNSDRLLQAFSARYGSGQKSPAPLTGLQWQGRKVMLSFSPATDYNDEAQALLLRIPE
ncbi:hypothetical protein [Hymenobacter tenuis]